MMHSVLIRPLNGEVIGVVSFCEFLCMAGFVQGWDNLTYQLVSLRLFRVRVRQSQSHYRRR